MKLDIIRSKVKDLPFEWGKIDRIVILESRKSGKKYSATVYYKDGRKRTVNFGHQGMQDYLDHKDKARRDRFRARFGPLYKRVKNNELSALAYSYPLLW